MQIEVYDEDELSLYVAKNIISIIIKKFISKDKVILALSGGSTPKPVYKYLGKYIRAEEILDEDRELHIIQVDERYTSKDSDRSNQKMIRESMNCDGKLFLHFHAMPTTESSAGILEASEYYEKKLTEILNGENIDIIVLGMGVDGHTASLFPSNLEYINTLKNSNKKIIGTFVHSINEYRISLSPSIIKKAENKLLILTGEEKGKTLAKAIKSSEIILYPIKNAMDGKIIIYMDNICEKKFRGGL